MTTNSPRLLLFDIDGTLLDAGDASRTAMQRAATALYGDASKLKSASFCGRTELDIWLECTPSSPSGHTPGDLERFVQTYYCHLLEMVLAPRILPGVEALLSRVSMQPGITIGILSGNFSCSGRHKLKCAGINEEIFEIQAWGDQARTRNDLAAIAMEAFVALGKPAVHHRDVVIVGDTPLDVAVARACSHRSLAVATGMYSSQHLLDAGADRVVPSLESDGVFEWMLSEDIG
jgi:phosphoglycolate phosphatase